MNCQEQDAPQQRQGLEIRLSTRSIAEGMLARYCEAQALYERSCRRRYRPAMTRDARARLAAAEDALLDALEAGLTCA